MYSCVKDLDFEQYKDSTFTIPMSIGLIDLQVEKSDFNNTVHFRKHYIIDLHGLFSENERKTSELVSTFRNSYNDSISMRYEFMSEDSLHLFYSQLYQIPPHSESKFTEDLDEVYTAKLDSTRLINAIVRYDGFPNNIYSDSLFKSYTILNYQLEIPLDSL